MKGLEEGEGWLSGEEFETYSYKLVDEPEECDEGSKERKWTRRSCDDGVCIR